MSEAYSKRELVNGFRDATEEVLEEDYATKADLRKAVEEELEGDGADEAAESDGDETRWTMEELEDVLPEDLFDAVRGKLNQQDLEKSLGVRYTDDYLAGLEAERMDAAGDDIDQIEKRHDEAAKNVDTEDLAVDAVFYREDGR